MSNDFIFGSRSRQMLYGSVTREPVKLVTQKLVERALEYTTVDFGVIDGHRTTEQQVKLYEAGYSELNGVNKISDHQLGLAIDVTPVCVDANGSYLSPWDIDNVYVKSAWLELYSAFMRASMKLKVIIEFGLGYRIGGGRDWPHISIKAKMPKDKYGLL